MKKFDKDSNEKIEFEVNGTKVSFEKINVSDVEINIGGFYKHISVYGGISCQKDIHKDKTTGKILIFTADSELFVSEDNLKEVAKFLELDVEEYDLTKGDDIPY